MHAQQRRQQQQQQEQQGQQQKQQHFMHAPTVPCTASAHFNATFTTDHGDCPALLAAATCKVAMV